MSLQLISHSWDLTRLSDEGYEIAIQSNHLVIRNVPYLNGAGALKFGMLVSELTLAGDVTAKPGTHVVHFAGEYPCNKDGTPIVQIKHQSSTNSLGIGLTVQHSFSSKPKAGYPNYYEKMSTYFAILSGPALSKYPSETVRTPLVTESNSSDCVFNYIDSASGRAGIDCATEKLKVARVAIVGLGGTGSYVLDLVAKTPVGEIHLFDGDYLYQHNAFRSPSAPSIEELRAKPLKVDYFCDIYSKMHRQIISHPVFVDYSNVSELTKMDFVFVCVDNGEARRSIIASLSDSNVPFVDVGMGVHLVEGALFGVLRITTGTSTKLEHIENTVPMHADRDNDLYSDNIQIADLNALNAAFAVIKWKKLCGFYLDLEHEHSCTYTIDGNMLLNEDRE